MITAILVDDELSALEELSYHLRLHQEIRIIGRYTNALDAYAAVQENPPDIVILDIDMPECSGLELSQRIQNIDSRCQVIFVTAYQEFAVKAFELFALDYLLKPISPERFGITIDRVLGQAKKKQEISVDNHGVSIRCFGKAEIHKLQPIKRQLKWRTNKAKELFYYLLYCHGKTIAKNELIQALFDGTEQKKAYNNLYVTMYYVRKSIDEFDISRTAIMIGDDYMINVASGICDYVDFLNLPEIDAEIDRDTLDACEAILHRYSGPFLAQEDYAWARTMREHLELKYEQAMLSLAEIHHQQRRYKRAETILNRLIEYNPLLEKAYQQLLDLYMRRQMCQEFTALFAGYTEMLKKEFALEPEDKYRRYFAGIVAQKNNCLPAEV